MRDLDIDTGGAVFGDRANDITFGEHADCGIAFGADDVFDDERADIARAHQLRGNADSLVHANRHNTRRLFAQDVSDLHRNLPHRFIGGTPPRTP